MRKLSTVLVLLFLTTAAFAQSHQPDVDYERVLIPVFYNGPGAFGADWSTTVRVLDNTQSFDLARPALEGDPACPAVCGCSTGTRVEERHAATVCSGLSHAAGLLIWVPRNLETDEESLHIQARARDLSRDAESAGTQIPVLRESDLRRDPMMLLDVPVDPRFRVTLRLYDAFQFASNMIVRIWDMDELLRGQANVPLVDTVVSIADPIVHVQPERFPDRPAFGVIGDLVAAYPQIAGRRAVAIEVVGTHFITSPPQYDRRFYALASVTNNETQQFTVIAPK